MSRRKNDKPGCLAYFIVFSLVLGFFSWLSIKLDISFWAAVGLVALGFALLVLLVAAIQALPGWIRTRKYHKSIDKIRKDSVTVSSQDDLSQFALRHSMVEELRTKVVGVTYQNEDGTSRQPILARCHAWDPVYLRFYRFHGEPAFAVVTDYGQIGCLSAKLAARLYASYGERAIYAAKITSVTGGDNGLYYGCNLLIQVYL